MPSGTHSLVITVSSKQHTLVWGAQGPWWKESPRGFTKGAPAQFHFSFQEKLRSSTPVRWPLGWPLPTCSTAQSSRRKVRSRPRMCAQQGCWEGVSVCLSWAGSALPVAGARPSHSLLPRIPSRSRRSRPSSQRVTGWSFCQFCSGPWGHPMH